MAFTESEIAEYLQVLEDKFWSLRRPALQQRHRIREGQRFTDQAIELFLVRPVYDRPSEQVEESLAKIRFVRTTKVWRLFWKRADGKRHSYPPHPQTGSLAEAIAIILKDPHGCFFG